MLDLCVLNTHRNKNHALCVICALFSPLSPSPFSLFLPWWSFVCYLMFCEFRLLQAPTLPRPRPCFHLGQKWKSLGEARGAVTENRLGWQDSGKRCDWVRAEALRPGTRLIHRQTPLTNTDPKIKPAGLRCPLHSMNPEAWHSCPWHSQGASACVGPLSLHALSCRLTFLLRRLSFLQSTFFGSSLGWR